MVWRAGMIKATLINKIIRIVIEGDLKYEDFLNALNPIFESKTAYIGFISDGRKLTVGEFSPADMMKINKHHQTHNKDKPNAILMNKDQMIMIAKIYMNFTGARNTRIFTDEKKAVQWVWGFRG
jgi:hypothetical protein